MNEFEQVSRPVLFVHSDPNFPYWGKGSSILVATAQRHYWVTALHVLRNNVGNTDSLCIFPSDNSRVSLPFNEQYTIPAINSDDDYKDVLILRVDLDRFTKSGDAALVAQDVENGFFDPEQLVIDSKLLIIGYPSESNWINYDQQIIRSNRILISAKFMGKSHDDHCHKLKVETSLKIGNLDGLSGSPVFYLQSRTFQGTTFQFPLLVGMLIRGTIESGIAHFISAKVIERIIRLSESH